MRDGSAWYAQSVRLTAFGGAMLTLLVKQEAQGTFEDHIPYYIKPQGK